MAPLTAYSICFTKGFIVFPVRILLFAHFPFAKEKERNCKDTIKDRFLNKLDNRQEAMFCISTETEMADRVYTDQLWMVRVVIPALAIVSTVGNLRALFCLYKFSFSGVLVNEQVTKKSATQLL